MLFDSIKKHLPAPTKEMSVSVLDESPCDGKLT